MSPAPWRLERDGSWSRDKPGRAEGEGDYAALVSWHERDRWWRWSAWSDDDSLLAEGSAPTAEAARDRADGWVDRWYPTEDPHGGSDLPWWWYGLGPPSGPIGFVCWLLGRGPSVVRLVRLQGPPGVALALRPPVHVDSEAEA